MARTYNSIRLNYNHYGDSVNTRPTSANVYRGKRQRYLGHWFRTNIGWHHGDWHPLAPGCMFHDNLEDSIKYHTRSR